jgi:DNA-binding NarL/FixJ family response regulator
MKEKIKIFHADRHQLLKEGLKIALKNHLHIYEFVGHTSHCSSLFDELYFCKPDILIISHRLYDDEVSPHLKKIKTNFPNIKILMLTLAHSFDLMLKVMDNVDGFISKAESVQGIIYALEIISKGERYITIPVE